MVPKLLGVWPLLPAPCLPRNWPQGWELVAKAGAELRAERGWVVLPSCPIGGWPRHCHAPTSSRTFFRVPQFGDHWVIGNRSGEYTNHNTKTQLGALSFLLKSCELLCGSLGIPKPSEIRTLLTFKNPYGWAYVQSFSCKPVLSSTLCGWKAVCCIYQYHSSAMSALRRLCHCSYVSLYP